jgi:hypothetical protein
MSRRAPRDAFPALVDALRAGFRAMADDERRRAAPAHTPRRDTMRASWSPIGGGWYAVPADHAARAESGRVTLTDARGIIEIVPWHSHREGVLVALRVLDALDRGELRGVRWELRP